jgi:flavin-binding protein dodecin
VEPAARVPRDQKLEIEKGKIKEYRVTMRVTFVLQD